MGDQQIGFIELTATTRIVFSAGSWKGRLRGDIRKFIATEKYTGPTKSGMSLDGCTAVQLLTALRAFQSTVPTKDQNQHVSVSKTPDWEIRIGIIPPDEDTGLPSVDIREFIETPRYSGPTKAGVRFAWDKLRQFTQLVEVLVQQLGVAASSEPTLFPEAKPKWVSDAKQTGDPNQHKPASYGFDATTLKSFPDAFLPVGKLEVESLLLPTDKSIEPLGT